MTDRRITPSNGRVAALHLKGQIHADAFVEGEAAQVSSPVADLLRDPAGPRERQLLMGDDVAVFERRSGVAFVQSIKDNYVGYVSCDELGPPQKPTHRVAVPAGHIYSEPDIKSPERSQLVFGNLLSITSHLPNFFETSDGGFVPKPFLWPLDKQFKDPVTVAQMHFGAPYLWGGNSVRGIDCSGLVQVSLHASGIACPVDSDQQQEALGSELMPDAQLQRGDFVFWKGHVGMMVDESTLIHANAHHMAVTYEPLDKAILRIGAQGGGPVTSRKRLQ